MKPAAAAARWFARTLAIVVLVVIGSTILVRFAPGYLSDAREMDARYGDSVRSELSAEAARSGSLPHLLSTELRGWLRGDGGVSREYGVPVSELIVPRLAVTGGLLLRSLILAWASWHGTLRSIAICRCCSRPPSSWRRPGPRRSRHRSRST